MILLNEIRQKSREHGVPVSTIERDYAQNWLLAVLSSFQMVLKGGTGIRKVYFKDYRFSDDLDFTLLESIEKDELKNMIKNAISMANEESGINFNDEIEIQENENGFEISVYFQIMQRRENRTKIKIDITKTENEKILLPVNIKKIIHPYSDNLNTKAKVYALEEIMAEKIRSLFQRTRPRDLYDVLHLWDKIKKQYVFKILPEKFKGKKVKLDIKDLISRKDNFKNAWNNSLGYQLKDLPEFDMTFSITIERIRNTININEID